MVFVIGLAYLLLSCPVAVRIAAGVSGLEGSVLLEVSFLGLCLRYDGILGRQEGKLVPQITARYAAPKRGKGGRGALGEKGGEAARSANDRGRQTLARVRRYAALLAQTPCRGEIDLYVRIGLEDAAQTALAAGACRAAIPALLNGFARRAKHAVQVTPEYACPCLTACLRGIFSASAGDIMFAAAKAALKKKRKEGTAWKNIPLKA